MEPTSDGLSDHRMAAPAVDQEKVSMADKIRILKDENDRLQVELARALGTIQRMSR